MKKRKVRLRPKVRSQRRSAVGAAAGGIVAVFMVGLFLQSQPWSGWRLTGWRLPLPQAAAVEHLSVSGTGLVWEKEVLSSVGWEPGDRWGLLRTRALEAELRERFSYIRAVQVRRSWVGRSVHFEIESREPLARIVDKGKAAGYIGKAGVRFEFPGTLAQEPDLPEVDLGSLPVKEDLEPLGRLLVIARSYEGLPARLVSLRHAGESAGWVGGLADGTRLLWGTLEWTEEKFDRLAEVLNDAGTRFGEGLTADLRHFEEGKILIRTR